MNRSRVLGVLSSIVYMTLLFTQFQNCAPPLQTAHLNDNSEDIDSEDSEVRIVDRWSSQKIQLLETAIVIRDSAEFVNLGGLCQLENAEARLFWEVKEYSSQNVMELGESYCDSGAFKVEIDNTASLSCDQDYELVVTDSANSHKDNLVLRKKCNPESTLFVEARDDGTDCYLEKISIRDEMGCYQVCYQSERIFSQDKVEFAECSTQLNAQNSN